MIFLIVIMVIICLITPIPTSNKFRWLRQNHAHRGLFDNQTPENTLGAFQLAIDEGLGIECDVRLSKDDIPIMMHDPTLQRLCSRNEKLNELSFDELKNIEIANSAYTFIDLKTFLNLVDGQVPIMIEIKPNSNRQTSVDKVYELLATYQGNVSVVSFDPRIVLLCKQKKFKNIPVGQIIEAHFRNKTLPWWQRISLTMNLYQRFSKADFISVNIALKPFFQWMTWFNIVVGIWPVKNTAQLQQCHKNNVAILEKEAL